MLRTVAASLAAAAVVAPPALAMHAPGEIAHSSSVSPPASTADLRVDQLGPKYVSITRHVPAVAPTQIVEVMRPRGFDWRDALVGVAVTLAAVAVATAAFLLLRRRPEPGLPVRSGA